jgi:outer membrane receptor protein involved in Fe transport
MRGFTTDGYFIVPTPIRGAADHRAGVRFATGDIHLDHFANWGNLFFKSNVLAEERQNGTNLTHNSTGLGTASLHYVHESAGDSLSFLLYSTREGFHATFSSVPANRQTERLTFTQAVPSEAVGGAALWQRHHKRWNWITGADAARVHAIDTDHLLPTGLRVAGGTQIEKGVFAQGDLELGHLRLFAGARESFSTHNDAFFSPTAGAAYGLGHLRFRGSVYRAFRAPTLNELYRTFSAGNTITMANPALQPETVAGVEAGADFTTGNSAIRVTAYRNSLKALITNVTLSSSPSSIVRQRANAAAALSRGVEMELRHTWRHWNGELKYLYVDSRYATGPRISQIPRHQGSADLRYQRSGTMFSVAIRSFDYQFDDDLNQFRLPGYAVVEFMARRRLVKLLSAELAIDNAFNRVYYTAFTPTPNTGQPRLVRIGLRWDGRI